MVGTRRVGTAVAVSAVGQPVAVVVLVVSAFRFRHNRTIGSRPSRRALAAELLLIVRVVANLASTTATLQTDSAIVAAIGGTSI